MPLDKLIVTQLVKKFVPFIDSEGPLVWVQEPAAGPYPEPDEFSGQPVVCDPPSAT
jgi:hypothetical protein